MSMVKDIRYLPILKTSYLKYIDRKTSVSTGDLGRNDTKGRGGMRGDGWGSIGQHGVGRDRMGCNHKVCYGMGQDEMGWKGIWWDRME